MPTPLNILAVTDLHFTEHAKPSPVASRQGKFGSLFLRKALHRLKQEAVPVDLIVVLGDLVDQGGSEEARKDLDTLALTIRKMGIPALVIPGNHDREPDGALHEIFSAPGLHEVGGYGFWIFRDRVGESDVTTRPPESLSALAELAAQRPDLPLVALQHNPVAPSIDCSYPFMFSNGAAVLRAYEESRVLLSLSGHYHPGQPPHRIKALTCHTVPAVCEAPFRFSSIRLDGREVQITDHHLQLDVPGLVDTHCHTEYAYCGTSVSAAACIAVSQALGLGGLCLTEHSFQLYLDSAPAWNWKWLTDEAMAQRAWLERGRMDAYRATAAGWRSPFVRLGLEVDLLENGDIFLAPQDHDGWDLLLGGVHVLPAYRKGVTTQNEAEQLYRRQVERLLSRPIRVLAHPFRFFRREGLQPPVRLYEPVADLLARHGVAAEINFHINEPDPLFFAACLKRGVRIALGTDSHDLAETGELTPHLRMLEAAGLPLENRDRFLFSPDPPPA